MSTNTITAPRFAKNQLVEFIGGTGKIINYHIELGSWVYLVEMTMGLEPSFGRIGYETTVVLSEMDMHLTCR